MDYALNYQKLPICTCVITCGNLNAFSYVACIMDMFTAAITLSMLFNLIIVHIIFIIDAAVHANVNSN